MWFVLRIGDSMKANLISELSNINGLVVEDIKDDEIVIRLISADLGFVVNKIKELSKKEGIRGVYPVFSKENL